VGGCPDDSHIDILDTHSHLFVRLDIPHAVHLHKILKSWPYLTNAFYSIYTVTVNEL